MFWIRNDEYANCIPNPECIPKYTKVKVLHTQDKHRISWAALQSYAATALDLATTSLPEYVATHSHQTDYLRPQELDSKTWEDGCASFLWDEKFLFLYIGVL